MRERLRSTWERLHSSYWFVPSLMALTAVIVALTIVQVDEHYRDDALRKQGWIYSGGPEGARAVLSTIAGSIITVAGTTFSITIAALSLASAQFGPRLLRNFMRDTGNQVVLGTFTSTFIYCVLILRTVRGEENGVYVPHISVTIGVVLAVVSLGVLIYFIHHIAESIQVGYIIDVAGSELKAAVSRLFPARVGEEVAGEEPKIEYAMEILATREGYVQALDEHQLLWATEKHGMVVRLLRRPGDYVVSGMRLALSSIPLDKPQVDDVRSAFTLGRTRTPHQDVVFAFLQLTEVALRALSPGVNDPYTAITCIDRITSAMRELTTRSLPHPLRRGDSGELRLIAYPYEYDDLVEAAFRHIREAAVGHWQVWRHLRMQLEFLSEQASDPRLSNALRRELAELN